MKEIKTNQFETNTDHEAKVTDSLEKINAFLNSLPSDIRESVEKKLRSGPEAHQTENNNPAVSEKTIAQNEAGLKDQDRITELRNQLGVGTVNESMESVESDSEKLLAKMDEFEKQVKVFGLKLDRAPSPAIRDKITGELRSSIDEIYPLVISVMPSLRNGDHVNDSSIDSITYLLDGSVKGFNSPESQRPADLTRFANSILSNTKNIVFKINQLKR